MKDPKNAIDERVSRVLIGDTIVETVEHQFISPQGHVDVQLFDERGRECYRDGGDNFVSRLWAVSSRSFQRLMWSNWNLNPQRTSIDGRATVGQTTPNVNVSPIMFPNNVVAAWNDATAEDAVNEHRVATDGQGIVAFASKFPFGSPAGARGAVNISSSHCDQDNMVEVYDWPTTAGNGTFQSVGYTSVYLSNQTNGRLLLRPSIDQRAYGYYNGDLATLLGNALYTAYGSGNLDAAGDLINFVARSDTFAFSCLKITSSDLLSGLTYDSAGAAEKSITPTVVWSGATKPTGLNSGAPKFLGESGGYYWASYSTSSTTWSICRVNKTTGAFDRVVALPTGGNGTQIPCGIVVGNDLWIQDTGSGGTGIARLLRYDLTANPPTLSATVTPTWPSTSPSHYLKLMCHNGTDLWLWDTYWGLVKMNTSGTPLAFWGTYVGATLFADVSTAPYASASRNTSGLSHYEADTVYKAGAESASGLPGSGGNPGHYKSSSSAGILDNVTGHSMFMAYGEPVFNYGYSPGAVSACYGWSPVGYNLGSRVLLGSPITKTSGNTMKITYTVTLPDLI